MERRRLACGGGAASPRRDLCSQKFPSRRARRRAAAGGTPALHYTSVIFSITKWYLDCVDEAGDACVVYWARIGFGPLALTFVSALTFRDGQLFTRTRISCAGAPRVEGDRLAWRSGGIDIQMRRREKPFRAPLLGDDVVWACEIPSADASFAIDGTSFHGRGYAEVLTLSVAPWKLPISELRWGRFSGANESLVWIEWRGSHPLTLVLHEGGRIRTASIDDVQVTFADQKLTLGETRILRDATIGRTLSAAPLLAHVVPRSFSDARETKWVSRGTLMRGDDVVDSGWAIHEVVRFR